MRKLFIEHATELAKFVRNIDKLSDCLQADLQEGFIGDFISSSGNLLLCLGNSELMEADESPHIDYFIEEFWNSINDDNPDWNEFYDKLIVGKAPAKCGSREDDLVCYWSRACRSDWCPG